MEFKEYVKKFEKRLKLVSDLYNKKELNIGFDILNKKKKTGDEILYFKDGKEEFTGLFVFGFQFFLNEIGEQEFKKHLGQNSINFKIFRAYKSLKKKQKKVKVSDILNQIQNKRKDSLELHNFLKRILTLAYYFNWDIEKDKSDLEGDSFIKIPDKFLISVTQRFNFDFIGAIYEDENLFLFLNVRGKLNLVFKDLDCFVKSDIKKLVIPVLKKVFKIKKVNLI